LSGLKSVEMVQSLHAHSSLVFPLCSRWVTN